MYQVSEGRVQRMVQALHSGAQCQDQRHWAQTEMCPSTSGNAFFTVRMTEHWIVPEVVRSPLGDNQNPCGHGPGQWALGVPP